MIIRTGHILLALLLMAASVPALSQNYIGMSSAEISASLKSDHPHFRPDKDAVNTSYKYLKYVDRISEQTALFFLSDDNRCTHVRWISDYSNLNDVIERLDRNYKKSGENTWTYSDNGQNYTVKLDKEEWYFTVTYRKK